MQEKIIGLLICILLIALGINAFKINKEIDQEKPNYLNNPPLPPSKPVGPTVGVVGESLLLYIHF